MSCTVGHYIRDEASLITMIGEFPVSVDVYTWRGVLYGTTFKVLPIEGVIVVQIGM